ncbi:Glucose oxidase [Madurella fahalii]|uniref:Glucose oxidase n=1 Tax=Madurella fahalii TaxID=1157608 RepID=A0ABQ0G4G2_9PEZI
MVFRLAFLSYLVILSDSLFVHCHPWSHRGATILNSRDDAKDAYDYVIVLESGKYSVLVIEYGYSDYDTGSPFFDITSQPSPELNNRTFPVLIGSIVGGSSAVNGMVFQRDISSDYDIWGELSGVAESTWNWENLLGYFRKAVQLVTPPPADLAATYNMMLHDPSVLIMYEAMKAIPGVTVPVDGAGGENGMFWATRSMDPMTFERSYAKTGHWDGLSRKNYELVTGTKVNKVVFKGNRAVGVYMSPRVNGTQAEDRSEKGKKGRSKTRIIKARKEVILAAGSIHTPQILQLSGIGLASLLEEGTHSREGRFAGRRCKLPRSSIPPDPHLPLDHCPTNPDRQRLIPDRERLPLRLGARHLLRPPRNLARQPRPIADRYAAQDPAQHLPAGTHPSVIAGYAKQQRIYAREMRRTGLTWFGAGLAGSETVSCTPQNLHPVSRGTVTIDLEDPAGREPIVDYRGAANPVDIDIFVEDTKSWRRYVSSGMLAQYNATEIEPGPGYETDEALRG